MDFFENASFESSGNICCSALPSSQLSMNKSDTNDFFPRRLVGRSSRSIPFYGPTTFSMEINEDYLQSKASIRSRLVMILVGGEGLFAKPATPPQCILCMCTHWLAFIWF